METGGLYDVDVGRIDNMTGNVFKNVMGMLIMTRIELRLVIEIWMRLRMMMRVNLWMWNARVIMIILN